MAEPRSCEWYKAQVINIFNCGMSGHFTATIASTKLRTIIDDIAKAFYSAGKHDAIVESKIIRAEFKKIGRATKHTARGDRQKANVAGL